MAGRGYNTFHGFDAGAPPPGFSPAQPHAAQFPGVYGFPVPYPMPIPIGAPPQPIIAPPYFNGQQYPAPPPYDQTIPGIHLRNHTGDVGVPWGYDYLFPKENCPIHVFKTTAKPWQIDTALHSWDDRQFVKLLVPVTTTIKELMQNLGANNADPKKNRLYEIAEAGNGKWLKGMEIGGDDKDKCKKVIKDYGWDQTRTGKLGEKPLVWLYITKD
ncbi:uncharacterized protein BP5553_08283 [Venustampulla echinocandica]|uniref:Uncharacterized protein n=1 Tax=Venustampulla echinocandica TaxID=2656787 RepID=A0A370TGA4_9HELO|nr:uncharacterized protein BP5553_08283 [Venustampulla echinocandica]RDL33915.1 hypothetical protein BP5553_08283 [Venustampulla echinocandica]